MKTQFTYQLVHESSIPLNVLYNESINRLKVEERAANKEPKPLTFSIKNAQNNAKSKTIRFEVLGEDHKIEANINEEEGHEESPGQLPDDDGKQELPAGLIDLKLLSQGTA